MKTFVSILIVLTFFSLSASSFCQTKSTTIDNIKEAPSNYEGDAVEFDGLVTQYVKGMGSTSYYLIKGDFGNIIRVNTSEPAPETNVKYHVKGIVYIDRTTNLVFVSEKSKYLLNAQTKKDSKDIIIPPQPPENNYTLLYILIGTLIVLVVAFIYFQFKKKSSLQEPDQQSYYQAPPQARNLSPNIDFKESQPIFSSENDYKTIKIVKTSPKTLKFIPGKLVLTEGIDKGKEFRIAGYPTSEGFFVTIGRKEVSGDRAYAHIYLNEKTVSKEQAELHYRDKKLYVKNLSETNYTQLNGSELSPGQMAEVTPGSTIRTGEVEFQYKLQ